MSLKCRTFEKIYEWTKLTSRLSEQTRFPFVKLSNKVGVTLENDFSLVQHLILLAPYCLYGGRLGC